MLRPIVLLLAAISGFEPGTQVSRGSCTLEPSFFDGFETDLGGYELDEEVVEELCYGTGR